MSLSWLLLIVLARMQRKLAQQLQIKTRDLHLHPHPTSPVAGNVGLPLLYCVFIVLFSLLFVSFVYFLLRKGVAEGEGSAQALFF